jgi:hypothetical protein
MARGVRRAVFNKTLERETGSAMGRAAWILRRGCGAWGWRDTAFRDNRVDAGYFRS